MIPVWVDAAWAAIIAAFLAFEVWAITNRTPGDTFSERTRHYFRVNTKTGAYVFIAILALSGAWFAAHIVQIAV